MGWSEWADTVEVEPSIYASDFSRLGEQLGALVEAGARVFHFDAGDGHFIPEITIGPIVLASLSPLVRGWGARLDCHLMVSEPERACVRDCARRCSARFDVERDAVSTRLRHRLEMRLGVAHHEVTIEPCSPPTDER